MERAPECRRDAGATAKRCGPNRERATSPNSRAILFSPQRHRVTEKAFARSLCLCVSVVGRSFVTFVTIPATGSFSDFLYDELER